MVLGSFLVKVLFGLLVKKNEKKKIVILVNPPQEVKSTLLMSSHLIEMLSLFTYEDNYIFT